MPQRLQKKSLTEMTQERNKARQDFLTPKYAWTDYVLGIDPGLKGGVALYDSKRAKLVWAAPTPVHANKGESEYAVREMCSLFCSTPGKLLWSSPTTFVLEQQQARPYMHVSSVFTVGYGFGIWRALFELTMRDVDQLVLVTPNAWQRILWGELAKDDTKAKSIARVKRLFPEADLKPGKRRTASDGIADAINIAHYVALRMKRHEDKE